MEFKEIMNTYITNSFDFHDAISKTNDNVDIIGTKMINDDITLVYTNVGDYWCTSIEIDNIIYMSVTEYK